MASLAKESVSPVHLQRKPAAARAWLRAGLASPGLPGQHARKRSLATLQQGEAAVERKGATALAGTGQGLFICFTLCDAVICLVSLSLQSPS